jgi:hypothetical protein
MRPRWLNTAAVLLWVVLSQHIYIALMCGTFVCALEVKVARADEYVCMCVGWVSRGVTQRMPCSSR